MFDHYLMTRFNLKNPLAEPASNSNELSTDAWSDQQMWVFENCCFKSIAAQSNMNFIWLLYFDSATAAVYKERIKKLIADAPNIEAFYIHGMPALCPATQKYIEDRSRKIPYLITTRIDYNSILHKDFIHEVQKKFKSQSYRLLNFTKGYVLQLSPVVMLGKKEFVLSPFASLIEKNTNPKTIWSNEPLVWKKERRITALINKRLWISVIDKPELESVFDGYDDVKWESLQDGFIVSKKAAERIQEHQLPYRQWRRLSLKNKIGIKYKVISKTFKKALGIYQIKK